MEREASQVPGWGSWVSLYAAAALLGAFLGERGMFEGGIGAVAASLCYTWALAAGAVWHGSLRRDAKAWRLAIAVPGVLGVWAVLLGTVEGFALSDAALRAIGSVLLAASGVVIGETAGRRMAMLMIFGVHAFALALGYVLIDMLGRPAFARIAAAPAVFTAPVIQNASGEILGIAFWGVVAAALLAVRVLRRRTPSVG
ncbi:MAG TPA: hypothetical protein ENN09_05595 [Planctomycetes bacterium]|nr:hypothetical protein [Planctomycetota bacterium]